jgi:hypothetical protein
VLCVDPPSLIQIGGRKCPGCVIRNAVRATMDDGLGAKDLGYGTRDLGYRAKDLGHRTKDLGQGTWDEGRRTRD